MTAAYSEYREAYFAPGISAYYHVPPLWVGTKPTDQEIKTAPESEFIKDVYRTQLSQGIRVRVRRDGVFVFDCSSWEPGQSTEIPGCEWMSGQRKLIPKEITEAEALVEQRAYKRIQLLTAHLACLGTVFGGGMQQVVAPQPKFIMTLGHFEQNDLLRFLNSLEPGQSYSYNNLILFRTAPGYRVPDQFKRIELSIEVIESSFCLLREILDSEHENILELIELLYKSVYNYTCHHFAESLILSWAICESLLNLKWSQYIANKRSEPNRAGISDNATRINSDRKQKLEGRDYTASIKSEMLELEEEISHDLFRDLNAVRSARNNWLHSLDGVSMSDAQKAIKTAKEFLDFTTGIKMRLPVILSLAQRFYRKDFEALQSIP
ncbi:hypothetical protein Lepto7375DRAFT_5927 [Leptolyngbya sp. PCC 7375]|nr:hypothetical protein Lepto7375DRAFT_5927 [Leptolyngbya sp. PCC 7375]